MAEKSLRAHVLQLLEPFAAFAVENGAEDGTPDVCCHLGWLELKQLDAWPSPMALVRPGLRPSQRSWLRRWTQRGGLAWVLLRVGRLEHLLLWGAWAAVNLDHTQKDQLVSAAVAHWRTGLDRVELVRCLLRK